jgi:5-methylcytosine-specific restriction protein A
LIVKQELAMSIRYRDAVGKVTVSKSLSSGARDFHDELLAQIGRTQKHGAPHIEVNSGELHRKVGGYPGAGHRMPLCCDALYFEKRPGDEIVCSPERGKGASLTIRYKLPRL